jgi:hypothetical protein
LFAKNIYFQYLFALDKFFCLKFNNFVCFG